jgi:hypothetical protein
MSHTHIEHDHVHVCHAKDLPPLCTGRRAQACRRSHGKAQELPPIRQLDDTMRIMTELEGLPLLPPSSLLLLRSNAASCDLVHAMENALRAAFLPPQHA